MKKGLILSAICLFGLCGCGRIPKLSNGEEAVITFKKDDKEHNISANELYEMLKNDFGLFATEELIDKYILETEFANYSETAKKASESAIDSLITSYGDEETALQALQMYAGFQTFDAYKNYLYTNSLTDHAIDEYAKLQITDKNINDYYNKEAKGDVKVYHILVTSKATSDMSKDEQTKAENEAKAKVEEIIKKLKDSDNAFETFKELVKEYSEDESTKDKEGNLGWINYYVLDSAYDELVDAAYKLKNGEFSTKVITTELGYHVIYRSDSKEKDTLDNLKDKITDILADRYKNDDKKIEIHALQYYRDLYNMKITDSELNSQYGKHLNAQLNAQDTTAE